MKVTKKAKWVKIKYKEVKSLMATYTCPTCAVHYEDYTISEKVLRIICSKCGQELRFEKQGE